MKFCSLGNSHVRFVNSRAWNLFALIGRRYVCTCYNTSEDRSLLWLTHAWLNVYRLLRIVVLHFEFQLHLALHERNL